MFKIFLCTVIIIFYLSINISAQIYVSPDGDDNNPGTVDQPFKTITKALSIAYPDSLIYLRGGIYNFSASLKPNRDGEENKYIKIWAYPGEIPILDFSGQSYSSSSRGVSLSRDYIYFKGLVIRNAGDNGMHISGDHNIVENCTFYRNKDTGLQISNGGSYNLVLNCDSYENYDSNSHGENADGFAPKLDVGPGNIFRGCRAWNNSDDGWDCYEAAYQIILDSCWSFHNGYNIWSDPSYNGDGNGFKTGGNYVPAFNVVKNCVAFDNVGKGFDQNHNTAGVTLYNNTAFRNGRNFVFNEAPDTGQHVLKNNISYKGSVEINNSSIEEANSWQGFNIGDSDFVSLDTSLAKAPRQSNGALPNNDFLKLSDGSSLINGGVDVGINFNGDNPDLGAFESSGITGILNEKNQAVPKSFSLKQNYPNPFNPSTTISYFLEKDARVSLKIYDLIGKEIETIVDQFQKSGNHNIIFNGGNFSSGVYFYKLTVFNETKRIFSSTKKLILLK